MSSFKTKKFIGFEDPELLEIAFDFRKSYFCDHKGWDIPFLGSLEFDTFDSRATHCLVLDGDKPIGYWRSISTEQDYFSKTTFQDFFRKEPSFKKLFPSSPKIRDISRYAIHPHNPSLSPLIIGKALNEALLQHAQELDLEGFMGITEPEQESLFRWAFRHTDFLFQRLAGPVRLGTEEKSKLIRSVEATLVLASRVIQKPPQGKTRNKGNKLTA